MKIVFDSKDGENSKIELEIIDKKLSIRLIAKDLNFKMSFDRLTLRRFIGALLHMQSNLNKELE